MKTSTIIVFSLFAALLAACNDETAPPPAPNPSLSLNPLLWVIGPVGPDGTNASAGMSLHPSSEDGWSFQIPQSPNHVNYIDTAHGIAGKSRITMTFEIVADPSVKFLPKPEQYAQASTTAKIRLYFQKANDNWAQLDGRWWSQSMDLSIGTHTLSADLVSDQWTNINGQHDAALFSGALAASARLGFTFGGDFAGHGMFSSGPAKFILRDFKVN